MRIYFNGPEIHQSPLGQQALNSANEPFLINPRDNYYIGAYVKNITLFTGYNIHAVEGAFGAVIFCMSLLPIQTIKKVEKYLSERFSIPLIV